MIDFYYFYAAVILLCVIAGLWRVYRGPTQADRMLSTQLCGTTIVAIVLLFAQAEEKFYLFDIALAFALLTAVATVAFVKLIWYSSIHNGEREALDD